MTRRRGIVHRYGAHPDQHAELHLPARGQSAALKVPLAVLIHGGYWRSRWKADLMHPMAADLAARGWAVWNLEYRRPDEHGWACTTADVAAGLACLVDAAGDGIGRDAGLDLDRVVMLGHSAGGQLVMRAAADLAAGEQPTPYLRPALTISLAGVLDLVDGHRRRLGEGAVSAALGGTPDALPVEYARSSPIARLPIGLPMAVVIGRQDDPHLVDISRAFVRAAVTAGDAVTGVEADGDHFDVIDPASPIWDDVIRVMDLAVGSIRDP